MDDSQSSLLAMAPLAATSPEATKVLFEGLPFRLNEPLPLRMRGRMGPKCPFAANKPLLVMIVMRSRNWLPTYLRVLFLGYFRGLFKLHLHQDSWITNSEFMIPRSRLKNICRATPLTSTGRRHLDQWQLHNRQSTHYEQHRYLQINW